MARVGRSPLLVAAVMLAACRLAAAAPLAIHIHSEHTMFQVVIAPGTVGTDDFELQLMSGAGNLLPVKVATLVLSLPGRGTEPPERKALLGADGFWHVTEVPIPQAGRWHVRVEAVTAFRKITLEDDFEVPAR
jgi:copper transport protein